MNKCILFVLVSLFSRCIPACCQELKGRVLTERATPAIGVTVQVSAKNKTTTNGDGNFKITVASLPDTLMLFGAGFEPYRVVITEKTIKDTHFEVVLLTKRKLVKEEPGRPFFNTMPDVTAAVKENYASNKPLSLLDTTIITNKREGVLAKSRILTAAEVNDFTKWKRWGDIVDNEFRQWSKKWGMTPQRRYLVQVIDRMHKPLVNHRVFLIRGGTKDTLWRAITDNTGKAELWTGFLEQEPDKIDPKITDEMGNSVLHGVPFEGGINFLSVDKPCEVPNEVDMAFVVDATGSMGDEIEFLKLELEDVIRSTLEKYSSLSLKASAVFYRDKGDEFLVRKTDFNDDLLKTLNFIKLQRAQAGGDYPEAVDEAMRIALDSFHWSNDTRAKLLFLILDAPPHDEAKTRIQQLTLKAATMGVRIIPIACSGTDKSTEFLLRCMALATNGTYTFLTDQSGIGFEHIEPTTDKYEVELLNSLLQRIIGQFLYAADCDVMDDKGPFLSTPENPNGVKVSSNPSKGYFTIESKKEVADMFITDFNGKIISHLPPLDKKGTLWVDISNYASGVYLIKYITKDNKWGVEKVVLIR